MGAAGIGIFAAIKKGKGAKAVSEVAGEKLIKNLSDIKFNKGVAMLEDVSKYTGIINYTDKAGNNFILEYIDGLIKKSTKNVNSNGTIDMLKENFEKTYNRDDNGKVISVDIIKHLTDGDIKKTSVLSELKENALKK